MSRRLQVILLLEDNDDDVLLLTRAFKKVGIKNPLIRVEDGVEATAYLEGRGDYKDRMVYPLPRLIVLDLKMPRMGGLQFLEWVNEHPEFHSIPTIVLTSSKLDVDVRRVYQLRASAYFSKPTASEDMMGLAKSIQEYWSRAILPEDQI